MDIGKLHNLAISSTGFIFDPVTGNSYNANETGVYIIDRLKAGVDVRGIAMELSKEYDVDCDTAEQDILQLIETLRSHFLI
ncbi:MAG TPA: PqqD family protein [Chitinispirillaceae bacterium]|jgi:hypothetical protein|nr:PqqD family protein [Chitinispirillaceae bacterium]